MKYEVILSAYNNPEVLRIVLQSYFRQTDKNFSVCVADDGSGPEVKKVVEECAFKGLPIRHVWHDDSGFRKTIILNKAVASSEAERFIFTDGDCIAHRNFILDHKVLRSDGRIVTGPRVYLREQISTLLIEGKRDCRSLENNFWLLWLSLSKKVKKPEQTFYYPNVLLPLLARIKPLWPFGANMAIDKEDFYAVNGFDEDFLGWGGEDIDLIRRLGVHGRSYYGVPGRAILYHMHHPIREPDDGNPEFAALKQQKERQVSSYCENGLNKWFSRSDLVSSHACNTRTAMGAFEP